MASVKSLIRSSSQPYYDNHYKHIPLGKSHSLSGGTQLSSPQNNTWFNRNSISSSFDTTPKKLLSVYMLQLLAPTTTASNLFDCHYNFSVNLDSFLVSTLEKVGESCEEKYKTMPPENNKASVEMMSVKKPPISSDCAETPHLLPFLASHIGNKILSTTMDDNKMSDPVEITQNNIHSDAMDATNSNVVVVNMQPENAINLNKKSSKADDQVDICTPVTNFKCKTNLAQVLSAPRTYVKKGRPSSKKQKKRKKEKCKQELNAHESSTSQIKMSSIPKIPNETQDSHQGHLKSACIFLPGKLNSIHPPKTPISEPKSQQSNEPDQLKAKSKMCSVAKLFFRMISNSEESDNDDADGGDEWSVNEQNTFCISPQNGLGFNFTLTLDSILKKASTNQASTSNKTKVDHENLRESPCKSDSFDDSDVYFCASPLFTESTSKDFFPHLSEDTLFSTNKSNQQSRINLLNETFEIVDNQSSADNKGIETLDQETDFETIENVNIQWNEHYPTAGFRSCYLEDDVIRETSVKVHFALEPDLLTVHILEDEERGCPWQQFAVDRERFERRIQELDKIISPVLDANHRCKIQMDRLNNK